MFLCIITSLSDLFSSIHPPSKSRIDVLVIFSHKERKTPWTRTRDLLTQRLTLYTMHLSFTDGITSTFHCNYIKQIRPMSAVTFIYFIRLRIVFWQNVYRSEIFTRLFVSPVVTVYLVILMFINNVYRPPAYTYQMATLNLARLYLADSCMRMLYLLQILHVNKTWP